MASTSKTKKTKGSLARFLDFLWAMVDDEKEIEKCSKYISWNESGTGIIIKSRNEFASHILPIYFNTQEFASFHRQLTNYGFKKLQDVEEDEFVNENFIRGSPELLKNIIKKKPPDKHQVGCSSDSGGIKQKGSSERRTSVKTHPSQNSVSTSLPRNPQNTTLSGEGPTLKCTYEQTSKRSDHQPSKKTRKTTGVSKHKNPATRMHPYPRPTQRSQKTPASEKDNSIHQIKPQPSILPGTTLLAQNNTSATPNQKSLEQPWWLTAGAATSELLFQMNNLGITDATPLQPHSYTDVSRQGTEESVYANLSDLAAIRLEPEDVGASASNHEVSNPMGTTPSCSSDLESDASSLSWITPFIADTASGEPNIDVFDYFSESTDIDDFQLENGGSRGGQPHKGWSLGGSSSSLTGEQSYFIGQQTQDDTYQNRVVSIEELDTNPLMEINRQQEAAVIADPGAKGLTEGSDQYFTSSDIDATSSGIYSDDDGLDSSVQNNSENVSQDQVIRTEARQDFEPKIDPNEVPFYKGADIFHIIFEHPPPSEVQSGRAIFESLGVVPLKRLNDKTFSGRKMPAAPGPCSVRVSVESEYGRPLGETKVHYVDDPSIYPIVLRHLASKYDGSNGHAPGDTSNSGNGESSNENTQDDSGSSGNGGFTQQLQSLQHLVNAAVASGALWFLEPIFKSTTGRMLLHSYKETSQLPEVIARENGHEETAKFLADITRRLSEETEFFPDYVQKIDWSELVFLVERAQEKEKGGVAVDQGNYQAENDLIIDTGYFGDVETSSGNLSPQSKPDSDDNSSEISFEDSFEEDETQLKTDAFKKYSDEKPDFPSRDLSDANFPKEEFRESQQEPSPSNPPVSYIDPAMSGVAPEHNPEQITSAPPQQLTGSAPVKRYVPVAPTDHHQRVDTQEVLIPIAVSSVGGSQGEEEERKRKKESPRAIPLCLPNNCTWDSQTGLRVSSEEEGRYLYVVEEAIEQLRKIKGPVCVVSIAGPYRRGKSFVLSEVFGQPEVFPVGHKMKPETMGIWFWIVPRAFEDSTGREFKVVLLDTEGTDAVTSESYDNSQIFTLTILLSSVLIYNSQCVPTRADREGLNYIAKLSQSIEGPSKTKAEAGKSQEDLKFFCKTFPFLIWLLRDDTLDLPPDCNSYKEYFLKEVFKVPDSSSAENQDHQKVANSILECFCGFEAFSLPPPTVDRKLMKNIKDNKSQMEPFFQELDQFRGSLEKILNPKKSFNEGELVTGEGLATLVQTYVEAINRSGIIPNIQDAWETFVEWKCSKTIRESEKKYEEVMESNLKEERPCDDDELRKFHGKALEKGENYFMTETVTISTNSTEKHLNKLKELLNEKLKSWKTRNEKLTREFCINLLSQLKEKLLDPVLRRLQGKEAAKISFDEINDGCNQIKEKYNNSAKGAKDVIAAVFAEFHPVLLKEQEESLNRLGQLKDYDAKLAKARQQLEKQRLEGATSLPPLCEINFPPLTFQVNPLDVISWFGNGSTDEGATARAAPNGSMLNGNRVVPDSATDGDIDLLGPGTASEGVQNMSSEQTAPTITNPAYGSSMRSFPSGILGSGDGPFGLLDGNSLSRGLDDFTRRVNRETQMNESPFQYLNPFQQILGGNSSQPPSMRSFPAGNLGSGDGLLGLLDGNSLSRGLDDFTRRVNRGTQMNESPFQYLNPFQQILGGNSSQPPSMRSFPAGNLGSGDGLLGLLGGNFLSRGLGTQMNESPFQYFPYNFNKLFE